MPDFWTPLLRFQKSYPTHQGISMHSLRQRSDHRCYW